LKGNWSLRRRQRLPLHSTTHPSPSLRITLHLWYNLHLYVLFAKGEKVARKGSNNSVFGDSCQRGRKYEPKAKGPHHHLILNRDFQIGKFQISILLCSKGGESSFQNGYIKTLLNTKRRISFRGSFVLAKEKAFQTRETRGEKFQNLKMLRNILLTHI
jgi:hypothetical protein